MIIKELKGIHGIAANFRIMSDQFGRSRKALTEFVTIGLPAWDPPPVLPPSPPDIETAQRISRKLTLSTEEERQQFKKVIGAWRKLTSGQPREETPAPPPPPPPPQRLGPGGQRGS